MKRFVSYLYSIYNNQKIHNAGFARMELRAERNRVDIHLKENGYAGKTGTVYLFIRKQKNIQGISIGSITFRGNQADFRYEQVEENIGQTPWQIMQMNGILIVMDDRPAFLSQWDEQPVDTSRFEVWNVDKSKEEVSQVLQPEKDKLIQAPEPPLSQLENEQKMKAEGTLTNHTFTNETKMPMAEKALANEMKMPMAEKALANEMKMPEAEKALANEMKMPEAEEALANEAEMPAAEEAFINDTVVLPTAEQPDVRFGQTKDEGENAEGNSVNIRTAELQPQPQSQWNQTWRYMLKAYPVLNQFADKYHVLCVRIEIKDMRLLPEKYWSIVNNSFLLHGFFNYRYLIFGSMGKNWFVGIPGIYQNQEHVMASIFGFPDFLPQKEKNERGEQPGYWYRILEF